MDIKHVCENKPKYITITKRYAEWELDIDFNCLDIIYCPYCGIHLEQSRREDESQSKHIKQGV